MVPLDGVKVTPERLLPAAQLRLPLELPVSVTVTIHIQPLLLEEQLVSPAVRLVRLTISVRCGVQLHPTLTGFAPPMKLKEPPIQSVPGTKMVTGIECPGDNEPFDGVNVAPERLLSLLADQSRAI